MQHQLGIEKRTKPTYRDGIGDEGPLHYPAERFGRFDGEDGLAEDDSVGQAPRDRQEGNGGRDGGQGVLGDARPQAHHCPGLVHQSGFDGDDEEKREDIGCDAHIVVVVRDGGVVGCPVVVEFVEGRDEEGAEKTHADYANHESRDVEDGGGPAELIRWGDDQKHQQHNETGTELRSIIDANAHRFLVEGVNGGDRNID